MTSSLRLAWQRYFIRRDEEPGRGEDYGGQVFRYREAVDGRHRARLLHVDVASPEDIAVGLTAPSTAALLRAGWPTAVGGGESIAGCSAMDGHPREEGPPLIR
ncbi:hypothetical protein [Geodermatophilus sabuli]|uniref:Uncharacterized protein n=1 Tax=Geodermatophilus sabuli TaxID=1564158 RepID=A0A285EEZ4_9ACTN|nr:hypothetical protein [Geodermatophilus sabuli]MBB3084080.1 hypothetical protein [Geodermatophilus sabuli]SNX96646.1 hypothetical protein SAMN06893097_104361 [Geodermatophilus sabuli]